MPQFSPPISEILRSIDRDRKCEIDPVSSSFRAGIDSPAADQNIYDVAIFVSGWVEIAEPARLTAVSSYLNDALCGTTKILFPRSDGRLGFRMLGRIPPVLAQPGEAILRVEGTWENGSGEVLAQHRVHLVGARLAERPYGDVVSPENETLLHRENIYGSGPPIEEAG